MFCLRALTVNRHARTLAPPLPQGANADADCEPYMWSDNKACFV